MQSKINLFFFMLFIVMVFIMGIYMGFTQLSTPPVIPLSSSKKEFSAERALLHINILARKSHPQGSAENNHIRDYLINQLDLLKTPVIVQKKKISDLKLTSADLKILKRRKIDLNSEIDNIFTIVKGTNKTAKAVLLVAHYDTRPTTPGAADDGYGVSTLLETVRIIKSIEPLKNDIIFLFTDSEEVGISLGAKFFIEENAPLLKNIKCVLNFEARGNKGPVIMFETSKNNYNLIELFKKSVSYPVAFSFSLSIYQFMSAYTDFTLLKDEIATGLNFAVIGGSEVYHSPKDNIANISKPSLQHYGSYSLALTKAFGNLDNFEQIEKKEKGNAVFFPVMKSVLILYSEKYVIPFSMAILLCMAFVIYLGYRRKLLSVYKIIISFFSEFVCAGVIFLIIMALIQWVNFRHTPVTYGMLYLDFKYSTVYFILAGLTAIIIIFVVQLWLLKKLKAENMLIGSLIIWSILLSLTSLYLKGASYLFTWPLLFYAIIAGLLFYLDFSRFNRIYSYIISFFALIPAVVLFVPVMYLIYLALTFGVTPYLMLAFVLIFSTIFPIIFYLIQRIIAKQN